MRETGAHADPDAQPQSVTYLDTDSHRDADGKRDGNTHTNGYSDPHDYHYRSTTDAHAIPTTDTTTTAYFGPVVGGRFSRPRELHGGARRRRAMNVERAGQVLAFLETADRLKSVYRATYLTTEDRHENDAEHTCHMALFALLLSGETDLTLDLARVLELVLVHDLVEIIAGDTPAYDDAARFAAKEREAQAAEEVFAMLPADIRTRLHDAWREFENGESSEARFVRALDRLQGFSQNVFSGGRNWREHGVSREMTRRRNEPVRELDPALATVLDVLYERATTKALWTREG